MIAGNSTDPTFWEFAFQHLTAHEKERFQSLRHVWTDRGKGRALIRAALNERALERYVLTWLSDPNLTTSYENWALLRDAERTHLLPSMAAGLSSILFAISVDSPDLNVPPKPIDIRPEPVIAAPMAVKPTKKATTIKRQIISLDDTAVRIPGHSKTAPSMSVYGSSAPKSLSSLCLKYEEQTREIQQREELIKHQEEEDDQVTTNKSHHHNQEDDVITVQGKAETPSSIHMFSFPITTDYSNTTVLTPPSDSSGVVEASEESYNWSLPSQNSSLRGSTSSCLSETDVANLKQKLQDQEKRCAELESRVAELSLENHRLRAITNHSSYSRLNYFSVSVPRVLLQKTTRKKFYAYEIHIIPTHGGDEWTVLRRYSDFFRLHRKYQKDNISVKTLDFPPKKKFGNFDAHFVEQRRQRLQVYLRHLITVLPEVSSCTTRSQLEGMFPFLKC